MYVKYIVLLTIVVAEVVHSIYPYFDTQDFIYNVPKVYRISITLDKLLEHYEKKPSKDPEWYIALGMARGQLEYTINELDKSVPGKLKENLQNITRRMDRIRNNTDFHSFVYRSKDYEYVSKAIFENMEVLSSIMEPISLGTIGTQKPYRFSFEQYVQEARTKMQTRKAADACTMQLLISAMETQTTQTDGACELTPECSMQIMKGSGLAFQQTSRVRAAALAYLFDCLEGVDLSAHIYKLCIQVYKETKSLEAWDHPPGTITLFMQQILYCATQGYGEFIKPRWMNRVLAWQEPKGCYSDDRQPFLKLTGFVGLASAPPPKDREEEYRVKKAATSEGVEGRYVNALYSAAYRRNELEGVEKGLRDLRKQLRKPKVIDFIETSLISRANKAKLLSDIGKEVGMPTAAQNFLAVVAENGRLKMLRRMINMFLSVMVAHRNEALCEVITAELLDDASRQALMEVLKRFVKEGTKIQLTEKVDESLIGGVVVGFEDKHVDMSISRRLNMYSELLKQPV